VTTPTVRRDIAEWVLAMPVAVALGFEYVRLHDGVCETRLTWRPELSHVPGAFQASPIGALADFTGASAAMSTQPVRSPAITVDYVLKLLAEARGHTLIARAHVLRAGGLTTATVDIHARTPTGEALCATALVTTRLFSPTTTAQTATS
jgi:uncharacterized protein (TIGR00369 family)